MKHRQPQHNQHVIQWLKRLFDISIVTRDKFLELLVRDALEEEEDNGST